MTASARIARLVEENLELRRECFTLAAQLAFQTNLVAALEDVIRETAKLRGTA